MRWWLFLLVGVVLVLLVLGAPIIGNDRLTTTVSGPPTDLQPRKAIVRAAVIADDYWPSGSRCLHTTYRYRNLPGRMIAQARWYATTLASSTYYNCTITFDPVRTRVSFALYCAAVVHEFGTSPVGRTSRSPGRSCTPC